MFQNRLDCFVQGLKKEELRWVETTLAFQDTWRTFLISQEVARTEFGTGHLVHLISGNPRSESFKLETNKEQS